MPNRQPTRLNSLFGIRAKKERRPAGVSRRRKKQLGFEPLEARQVMSASSIVEPPTIYGISSASSGLADEFARELYWQSQLSSSPLGSGMIVNSIPSDPFFQNQWHLFNTGQAVGNPDHQPIYGVVGEDINAVGAWQRGYTGAGVTVAVIDTGTQLNHPDLAGNINLALALDALNPQFGNGNPNFFDPSMAHGTAVAGLIGAIANNGIGGSGVAPGVTLAPIRLIDGGQTEEAFILAFRHAIQDIDITNNSWGSPTARMLAGPTEAIYLALRDSVIFGRQGKGVIHVFSAGNNAGPQFSTGFQSIGGYDSSSYSGYLNSRYVIGVTGVDHDGFYNNNDGTITAYPEVGANILVAAPTGSNAGPVITNDTGIGSGLWTTDLTGEFGYNVAPDPVYGEINDPAYPFDRDFLTDDNYTSRMNGTSAAAPLVSGVIALMLEANPELTWRDVQEILVRSARQNAPLGVPSSGQTTEPLTQNTWIVNQMPIFHDPDRWSQFVPVDASLRLMNPTLDPNQQRLFSGEPPFGTNPDHYVATPFVMTNGAGYTVSQGIGFYGEQIGYAHGVVDAEMAVLLAEQWHTKGQALAPELTYTSYVQGTIPGLPQRRYAIPAAQQSSQATGRMIVPGGIGGLGPFIQFWEEYFDPSPDFGALPPLYRGDSSLEFNVPDNQTMKIETVEVKVSISGGTAEAMDHLRILLVSPDGTHSELNNFWITDSIPSSFQLDDSNPNLSSPLSRSVVYGDPGSVGAIDPETGLPSTGNMVWTFLSNRNWGERSNDAIVYDPVTGEPVIDVNGLYGGPDGQAGDPLTQGWRVVIENYSLDTSFRLDGIEVAFHGSPIEATTQRVQGFIGVDDNRDGLFNYSRVIRQTFDIDNDPSTVRLGEIQNIVDPNQETFAKNITVTATRVSDGSVKQFVTGHDGNFYFDLVPDEYIISIEDPEGRLNMEDSLTASGVLDKYKTEWHITLDHFKAWDHISGRPGDVAVDANGVPIAWLDGNGNEAVTGMKGINFLLDPGEPPAPEATFTGTVYADINSDGVFNGSDVALPNVTVFGDVNANGMMDVGEVSAVTDGNGQYSLIVTGITAPSLVNVKLVLPAQWTASNPASGVQTRFVTLGDVVDNLDFYIVPPASNPGGGDPSAPGILSGVVFEDANGNGSRGGNEVGASNVTVYIDADDDGEFDAGEKSTTTNVLGSYAFVDVPPGPHVIRIVVPGGFLQTLPGNGSGRSVNLPGSGTLSNLNFGIQGQEQLDFGDLPASYDMRPVSGGPPIYDPARHTKGAYWMGAGVDGETSANHSAEADGDDLVGVDDEDGVAFGAVEEGKTWSFVVTANTFTAYLQGWADWNNDGDFLDAGERIVTDKLLQAGANNVTVSVPLNVAGDKVNVRFRLGEHSHDPVTGLPRNTDTPFGRAATGEVEDYRLDVIASAISQVVGMPADFDQDNDVDGNDFLTWQRNLGTTSGAGQAQGSVNGDGDVDGDDLAIWKQQFGETLSSSTGSSSGSVALASTASVWGSSGSVNGNSLDASGLSQFKLGGNFTAFVSSLTSASPLGDAAGGESTVEFGAFFRPDVSRLADRLREVGERAKLRFDAIGDSIEDAAAELADKIENFEFDSLRRDRAFEDLFGSQRRRGVRADLELELAEADGAEEAFAAIGDHFEWRGR